ncbi:hypothetical protein J19TS2_59870 [Cohnella xylanilytica]|nr:hypothetical protein [Cohnella xylanilytica]GIO16432.1 hypothetical protein J19TS2_59870 [Cohnella xylanilytica]
MWFLVVLFAIAMFFLISNQYSLIRKVDELHKTLREIRDDRANR